MKKDFSNHDNAPKSLAHIQYDIIRDNIRRRNPDKSDKELGIDKPFFQEMCLIIFVNTLRGFLKPLKKLVMKFVDW